MNFFSTNRKIIDDQLEALLEGNDALYEAARYSTLGKAKRLRPLIVLAIAIHYEVPVEKALTPACALELLHTYTLIHDDLPCMDDETERRGKPPLHKAYPEALALLTGDALLTLAFETLASAPHLDSDERIQLIQTLSHYSGIRGVIQGQVLDLYAQLDEAKMIEMYKRKTADLFTAAFEFGAQLAHVDREPLREFGELFGLAFQFADDLHDEDNQIFSPDQVKAKLETLIEQLERQAEQIAIPTLNDLIDQLTPHLLQL